MLNNMQSEKVKICPNGNHSNGNPDCHCGEKIIYDIDEDLSKSRINEAELK